MTKVILHIGYPKTATKWFLGNFYPYVKNAGIIYNENLYYDTTPGKEFFEVKPDEHYIEKELKIIATHALSGFGEGKLKIGSFRPFFLKHLKQKFPDASIIIFIRNQYDFLSSLYSSYLKKGGTEKIQSFYKRNTNDDGAFFSFDYLNYAKAIMDFQNEFGPEKVNVFLYEDFLENNFQFLSEFSSRFNISIDLDKISYQKKNEKLRSGLITLLQQSNKLFEKGLQPKKSSINAPFIFSKINLNIDKLNQYNVFGKRLSSNQLLTDDLKAFIHEYYKDSNKILIDNFGLEAISKYKYPL